MPAKRDDSLQKITVDGNELTWQVRHGWVHDNIVGMKGISVSVWQQPGRTRELVIDFPYATFGRERWPRQEHLIDKLVPAIRAAIEGGWDPEGRGRTVRYVVPPPEEETA